MGKFSDYFRRKADGEQTESREEYGYYEDAHGDAYTDRLSDYARPAAPEYAPRDFGAPSRDTFTSPSRDFGAQSSRDFGAPSRDTFSTHAPRDAFSSQPTRDTFSARGFSRQGDRVEQQPQQPVDYHASQKTDAGKTMQNFMVYEPKNADDVQTLIDFLKTRESAIINLDNVDPAVSQRVLDFVSGAIYALNGSVHRIASNIFLLSPEGVGITNSYGIRNDNDRK